MINRMKSITMLFLLTILFITIPLSAQLKRDGLIISEVYLNEDDPEMSWLEVYNPTKELLVLEKFRFYDIMTDNILPQEIQEKGGIEILPGECIVLCSNEETFDFPIKSKVMLIPVSAMISFGKGGFFSLQTKGLEEDGVDIIRYGDPEKTSKLKTELGNFVVPFSKSTLSFSRIENESPEERFLPNFIQSEPSPGSYTKKGAQNE